eukprot:316900-Prymnesium_polylepis.1
MLLGAAAGRGERRRGARATHATRATRATRVPHGRSGWWAAAARGPTERPCENSRALGLAPTRTS